MTMHITAASGPVVLSAPEQNPLKISATGSISAMGVAVDGIADQAWTISNFGAVSGAETGILLEAGGEVTNGSRSNTTASILAATHAAIVIQAGPGAVNNFGSITSQAPGSVPIILSDGGKVTNHAGATILGGKDEAILISGGLGTVINEGTAGGVNLADGGTVTNKASGVIGSEGVAITGAPGTVNNQGIIGDAFGLGVNLIASGDIINSGMIKTGVFISNGGTVTNKATGVIGGSLLPLHPLGDAISVLNTSTATPAPITVITNNGTINNSQIGIHLLGASHTTINDTGSITGVIGISDETTPAAGRNVITVKGSVTGTGGVAINMGTNDSLILYANASISGSIANFQDLDSIDLVSVNPNKVSFTNGDLHYGSHNLAVSGPNPNLFAFHSDGAGGTIVLAS